VLKVIHEKLNGTEDLYGKAFRSIEKGMDSECELFEDKYVQDIKNLRDSIGKMMRYTDLYDIFSDGFAFDELNVRVELSKGKRPEFIAKVNAETLSKLLNMAISATGPTIRVELSSLEGVL
jgi:hypothetical protein